VGTRIEVENDPLEWRAMRVEEEVDQQPLDRRRVMGDLAIAIRPDGRALEPVERALAGEWRTIRPSGCELAGQHRHHRIVAQLVMVDQVLIAERDPDHPLADQRGHRVLDPPPVAPIAEAGREALDQTDRALSATKQQRTRVRGDRPAVKRGHHRAAFDRSKRELVWATFCRHRGAPLLSVNSLSQKNYRRFRAPMHLCLVRDAG
jgi:hypothetical protein